MAFRGEPTAAIGALGTLASFSLVEVNLLVSLLAGLATFLFVVTRWLVLVRTRGGFRSVFFPTASPIRTKDDDQTRPPSA